MTDNLSAQSRAAIARAKRCGARSPAPYRSDAEILDDTSTLLELHGALGRIKEEGLYRETSALAKRYTRHLHRCIGLSSDRLSIAAMFKRCRLSRLQREIMLVLALSAIGVRDDISTASSIAKALGKSGKHALAVTLAVGAGSRLEKHSLVRLQSGDQPCDTRVFASDSFTSFLVSQGRRASCAWDVKTYDDLLDRLYDLFAGLVTRAQRIDDIRLHTFGRGSSDLTRANAATTRLMAKLDDTARAHPSWPIRHLTTSKLSRAEKQMLIVLMGKELGFMRPENYIFTGEGLARSASQWVPEVRHRLRLLGRASRLRARQYIRICGGVAGDSAFEDASVLSGCEFELTEEFIGRLRIKRKRSRSRNRSRKPAVTMSRLSLDDDVREGLDMALAQVRHSKVLMDDWGLANAVPYGRGVTMLFSGPPGTGKTACAEATASRLKRDIMVANYAEIQNCWVGQTEKNIVRIFRSAADDDAVLFWDEADAMFFDRDSASRNFEVRDVNVLLQELERFDGLCILATVTNRFR